MNAFEKTRGFLNEVVTEMKRSSWPTRRELMDSTTIIILTMVALGAFVAAADYIFIKIVSLLTGA